MESVGIFETKTKLSEICSKVAESGEGIVITRRGEPIVELVPAKKKKRNVVELWEEFVATHGPLGEEGMDSPERSREILPDSTLF